MRVLVGLLIVLALAPPARSCEPAGLGYDVSTGATPLGQYYVDNALCQTDCVISIWIYRETNGINGLQRQDEIWDDTCGGQIPSDTLVAVVHRWL